MRTAATPASSEAAAGLVQPFAFGVATQSGASLETEGEHAAAAPNALSANAKERVEKVVFIAQGLVVAESFAGHADAGAPLGTYGVAVHRTCRAANEPREQMRPAF
ncbi:MAG: hypothetical protein IPG50_38705 [Myxococcales bacterium]|nr:hypothetical protein [Myxococcales bacterium]